MTREDAAYQMILLKSNITDEYDAWLDHYLEIEDPLSDILLKLLDCRSHLSDTISCLQFYCWEKEYDHQSVAEKLRLYLKNAYLSGNIDRETCVNDMYAFAYKSERMHEEFAVMSAISDYYELAEDQWQQIGPEQIQTGDILLFAGDDQGNFVWVNVCVNVKNSHRFASISRISLL
jgi:hypothetical protein